MLISTLLPALGFAAWSSRPTRPALKTGLDRILPVVPLQDCYLSPGTMQGYPGFPTNNLPSKGHHRLDQSSLSLVYKNVLSRVESSRSSRSTRSEHTPPALRVHARARVGVYTCTCDAATHTRHAGETRPARLAVSGNRALVATPTRMVGCGVYPRSGGFAK